MVEGALLIGGTANAGEREMKSRTSRAAMVVATVAAALVVPLAPSARAAESRAVTIAVRPGSTGDPQVNVTSAGLLPVAVLSADGFDATTVVGSSVCFGDAENAEQRDCTEAHGTAHPEDVDGDGDLDALFHFDTEAAGFDAGDTKACLEGTTTAGTRIYGCDGITTKNGAPERFLPDLSPSLTAEPAAVDGHGGVVWTATVVNDGLGAMTVQPGTTVLRFEAPANLVGPAVTAPSGYGCAAAGTTFDCAPTAPDTVSVGASRVFTLSGTATAAPGPITVKAIADPAGAVAEVDETDNTVEASSVVRAANLTTTMTADPGALSPGELATWTATLRNGGPGSTRFAAGTPVLRFTVPAGMTNVIASGPAGYACAPAADPAGAFDCAPTAETTLVGGAEVVFELRGYVPSTPGNVEVTATADPTNAAAEGDETDNASSASVLVALPNLFTTLAVTPEEAATGEITTWTATVKSTGPGGVLVPFNTALVRITSSVDLPGAAVAGPSGYTCNAPAPRTFECAPTSSDTLPAGADRVFTLTAAAPATAGTVDVTAAADPTGAIAESDEADNAATRTLGVVAPPVDLTTTISVTPNPVDARRSVQWPSTVTNSSPGSVTIPSGTHIVRFTWAEGFTNIAVSTPGGYSCFITAPQTADCAATSSQVLAPGQTLPITFFATAPREPGPAGWSITVDPDNAIAEGDEANNTASTTVLVQPPDFSMVMTAAPDPADAQRPVQWNAVITNDGPAVAVLPTNTTVIRFNVPADLVNLAVSTPAGYTCFLAATTVVECNTTSSQTIAVGGTIPVTLFGTAPRAPGERSVTATADPLGAIPEADEADNIATTAVTVQPPDLSITLDAVTDPADARFSTTWNAVITNDGPAVAVLRNATTIIRFTVPEGLSNLAVSTPSGYSCFIAAPQVVDCNATTTTTLAVGGTIPITMFGTAPATPGPLTMTATADPLGTSTEADETDNTASDTITVQAPDFSMALTATPDPADARTSAQWNAVITNDGPARARVSTGTTMIRFVIPTGLSNLAVSTPSGYSCFLADATTVECDTTSTQTIEVGATIPVTLFATMPATPGSVSVTATADPDGSIPEADEADNSASYAVTVQPPDLSMTLTTSADPVDARTSTTWVARITNDGPAIARISNGTTFISFNVPAELTNLAVSTPSGYTCFIASTGVIHCNTTATTTIAVGATVDITLFGTAPRTPGPLSVTATADPLNAIPEGDEGDNAATRTVTVQPPDFSVAMTTSGPAVATGGTVSWNARVANDGPAVARIPNGTNVLRFSVPPGVTGATVTGPAGYSCVPADAVTFDCTAAGTQTVAVGATLAFTLTGTAPTTPGDLSSTATADPLDAVPEADETDNAATGTITAV